MSQVLFISDLHLDHKHIFNFAGPWRLGTNLEEMRYLMGRMWDSKVTKRDIVWVLGDVAFGDPNMLGWIADRPGRKMLVRGNHDDFDIKEYLLVFDDVFGIVKYKHHWLSHAPIHPEELRQFDNIHGHVHQNTLPDKRYINVCVENTGGGPVSYQEILSGKWNQFAPPRTKPTFAEQNSVSP